MDPLDLIAVATVIRDQLAYEGRKEEADFLSTAIGATRHRMQALRSRALYVKDARNHQSMRQMAADLLALEVVDATVPRPSSEVVAFHDVRPVGVAKREYLDPVEQSVRLWTREGGAR